MSQINHLNHQFLSVVFSPDFGFQKILSFWFIKNLDALFISVFVSNELVKQDFTFETYLTGLPSDSIQL